MLMLYLLCYNVFVFWYSLFLYEICKYILQFNNSNDGTILWYYNIFTDYLLIVMVLFIYPNAHVTVYFVYYL